MEVNFDVALWDGWTSGVFTKSTGFVQDALDEIARQRPRDLYKPLRVHFIGEDGIDAGGVKKEFFQLLVTELLCPDYGMLVFMQVWSCLCRRDSNVVSGGQERKLSLRHFAFLLLD